MRKLLTLLDDHILKFGVAFAILFIALYPKLPSVNITHTWVYIRLEDFLILALALIWFIQLLRKKVSLPKPEGYALVIYWIVGLASLIYCLIFIAPQLVNFFPKIAAFQYVRRIEYMILFFIAFSTIRNTKDVHFYLKTLCITVLGIVLYGFGQRFYLPLWSAFPNFFEKIPFCFPAFLTGNEEFAKGTPLCLNETSRITSTFGGHYDLAAYMVLVIPILIAIFLVVKRTSVKILVAILAIFALELLNFTSSRVSTAAYFVGIISMLILWRKKLWIVPILLVSLGVMILFSNATLQRYAKTIQEVQVVSVNTGDGTLSADLQKVIDDTKKAEDNKKPEVPPASDFTVGGKNLASSSASYTTVLTDAQLAKLRSGDISISTVSGSFLIQKAYALDVSFTTRFQAEWPRNWNAFLQSPIFGTGYSSLTLATDNDYLRALGETGLTGLIAFLFIFLVLGIAMKHAVSSSKDSLSLALYYGLAGGIIGHLLNAVLIDVFEASKVAEPMWLLLGVAAGAAAVQRKHTINYKKEFAAFFTSVPMLLVYLIFVVIGIFIASINNFFVADDFIWLKWAATATPADLPLYFLNAHDFFYRPLDKVIVYFLYMVFSFHPQGYHIFAIVIHILTTFGVFWLAGKIVNNKLLAFLTAILFALHPIHSENIFWFSTISVNLGALFIIYACIAYLYFRQNHSWVGYILAVLLSILAFLSYEISVIIPLLLLVIDLFIIKPKIQVKTVMAYLPFIVLVILYFVIRYTTHAFSGGGDYSYNLSKIVPNVLGNFFGYSGLFLGGFSFMPIYNDLREGLRSQWVSMSMVLIIATAIGIFLFYKAKDRILSMIKNPDTSIVFFGIAFAFVSLLPFLPLGNIAPRYVYLASFGFCLAVIIILHAISKKILSRRKFHAVLLIAIVLVIGTWYSIESIDEYKKWLHSGNIAKQTLMFFRTSYASFTPSTTLYFVNTPVKQNDTWVFPVGLSEGLWFIYRERMPKFYQVRSVEEAKMLKKNASDTYIFLFDKNGTIGEVKQ